MEHFVPPYPGGTGDENFSVYQANKIVWEAKHWQEKIFDPLKEKIEQDKFNNQAEIIKNFTDQLLKLYPFILLSFDHEFPKESKDSLRNLLPTDYRTGEFKLSNWRKDMQTLIAEKMANRMPNLKKRAEQAYLDSNREPPTDVTERAINNFLYTTREIMFPPKNATRKYKKEYHRYSWAQRNKLQEIIGVTNINMINVCMEYLSIMFSNIKNEPKYDETKKLLVNPFSIAIKKLVKTSPRIREDEALRAQVARFALENVIGPIDTDEMQIPEDPEITP